MSRVGEFRVEVFGLGRINFWGIAVVNPRGYTTQPLLADGSFEPCGFKSEPNAGVPAEELDGLAPAIAEKLIRNHVCHKGRGAGWRVTTFTS